MASGSVKDVVKAIESALISAPPDDQYTDALQAPIQAYLDLHDASDEHASQRLQDELLKLFNKHVAEGSSQRAVFLWVLKQLRPAIRKTDQLLHWWTVIAKPTLESTTETKLAVSNAQAFVSEVLVTEDSDRDGETSKSSAAFLQNLVELYLATTEPRQESEEVSAAENGRRNFIASRLEALFVVYGRRRPKEFMIMVDQLLVQKQHRLQALILLGTFVRYQPPHLHDILNTPLLSNLLKCLMKDTSTAAVSLALTALVMFVPHIPDSLVNYLPQLYVIYSRLLCWERQGADRQKDGDANDDPDGAEGNPTEETSEKNLSDWEHLADPADLPFPAIPELVHLFTFLYGLYPLNLMSFIRKPRKYLRNSNTEDTEVPDLDQAAIRSRSEQFCRVHLLHPNFYTTTPDEEISSASHWVKSDPADIVAKCMALCAVIPPPTVPSAPPTAKLPDIPPSQIRTEDIALPTLLSGNGGGAAPSTNLASPTFSWNGHNWRDTQSTAVGSNFGEAVTDAQSDATTSPPQNHVSGGFQAGTLSAVASPRFGPHDHSFLESPTIPPQIVQNATVDLQDMLQAKESLQRVESRSNTEDDAGSHRASELLSPRLQAYTQSLSTASRPHSAHPVSQDNQGNLSFLQREIMLLRNDLNFERYLKQQHLSHIGRLQRKYIREATAEAETQNLLQTNKLLKLKLDEAKQVEAQLKKEWTKSKLQQKKWEAELNGKIRALKEERRKWQGEEVAIREALAKAVKDCAQLRRIAAEAEAKELHSKQRLQSLHTSLEDVEGLRQEVEKLKAKLREFQVRENEFEKQTMDMETLRAQLEATRLLLKAKDVEYEGAKVGYERTVAELEHQLQQSQAQANGQPPANFEIMLEMALRDSRERYANLQKSHFHLLQRYNELDMQYSEVKAQLEAAEYSTSDPKDMAAGLGLTSHDFANPGSGIGMGHAPTMGHFQSLATRPYFTTPRSDVSSRYMEGSTMGSASQASGDRAPHGTTSFQQHQAPPVSLPASPSPVTERPESSPMGQPSVQSPASVVQSPVSASTSGSLREGKSREGSVTSSAARSEKDKAKVSTNSQVRIYGRGGGQNIGLKIKEKKDKDPDKKPRPGFRGLRGFGG